MRSYLLLLLGLLLTVGLFGQTTSINGVITDPSGAVVPAASITTAASGDTGLLVETAAQTNQPKNRRVVIVIQ